MSLATLSSPLSSTPLLAVRRVAITPAGDDHGRAGIARDSAVTRKPSAMSRSTPESAQLLDNLRRMAKGEHAALARAYDLMGSVVFSLAVRMLRLTSCGRRQAGSNGRPQNSSSSRICVSGSATNAS